MFNIKKDRYFTLISVCIIVVIIKIHHYCDIIKHLNWNFIFF